MRYKLEDLRGLWEEVAAHSTTRQALIKDIDAELCAMEKERMEKVSTYWYKYSFFVVVQDDLENQADDLTINTRVIKETNFLCSGFMFIHSNY